MLRRILIVVLTGGVPLLLLHWNERPGHHVPNWLLYVSALPFLWVAMSDEVTGTPAGSPSRTATRAGP